MQQTEKYHFNIIDPSDDFSPEKLNENARALEDALITHEAAVSAALSQQKSALEQTIAAVEKGAKLFHLAGPLTRQESDPYFVVDMSALDMSQYRAVLAVVRTTSYSEFSSSVSFGASVSLSSPDAIVWFCRSDTRTFALAGQVTTVMNGYAGEMVGSVNVNTADWSKLTTLSASNRVCFLDLYGIKA